MDGMIERIEREAGVPGLAALLAERLEPTDLQSLLLEVFRRRVQRRRASTVLAEYEGNRFVHPAAIAPARLLAWEQVAFGQLPPEFEAMTLSPVCPLGTCAAVAPVHPNWSVATVRNTEVVSDTTNVLALECALRRRELLRAHPRSVEPVHLAASQRVLRAQHYDHPSLLSHFHLFALCSAGRAGGGHQFEVAALVLHARFYLRALRAFLGGAIPLRVSVTDLTSEMPEMMLEAQLLAPTLQGMTNVSGAIDHERTGGRGYYTGLCFHIHAAAADGPMELVDGGAVDWTQKLLSDAKERLVISGIGSERVCG